MALKKNVNHKNMVVIYNYLVSWANQNGVDKSEINIFDKLKLGYPANYPNALAYYTDPGQWSPSPLYVRCYRYARKLTQEPNFFLKCGRTAANNNAVGYWKYIALLAGGPIAAYNLLPSIFGDWNDTKTAEIVVPPYYSYTDKRVKLIFKYTCHPHIVPEDEFCTDPHIRGLMETIPTHWPKSVFTPWKKLSLAEVQQTMVQHDPIKLFSGDYFKQYDLKPYIENGGLFIKHPATGKHEKIGREVTLVKTRMKDRCEYIGEYKNPIYNGKERLGTLVFTDIQALDGEIITQNGTIYNSPHFTLIIKSQQPSMATRLLNIRHIFHNDKKILEEVDRITSRMHHDLVEKQRAVEELTQMKTNLEQLVAEKTEQLEAAHAQILDNEKRKVELLLTGGFAHEIKNALSGLNLELYSLNNYRSSAKNACQIILENLQKLDGSPESKDTIKTIAADIQDTLDETGACMDTVYKITDQVRNYAKISKLDTESVTEIDIVKTVKQLIAKHRNKLNKANIEVSLESSGHAAFMEADPLHFESIINNLLLNAIESIESANNTDVQGKILINISFDEKITIDVIDNGQGIQENMEDIFKPFYTTKVNGSGLGLSFVARLVQIYGGEITAASTETGAKFTVIFPQ